MRYMILIYGDEAQQEESPAEAPEVSPPWLEYTEWLLREGIHRGGERLAMSSAATTVRIKEGNRLITDGPYAETKEVLGGYYIVECEDLDKALEAAARCPAAIFGGSVEVRPIIGMAAPALAPMPAQAGSPRE